MASVLVFDSGSGGLSVLKEIRSLLPGQDCHYLADVAAFPYGNWEEGALAEHVVGLTSDAVEKTGAGVLVIACSTASTLVLPLLRERLTIPIVGTVPAIKPAAALTDTGVISVLATPGTVKRDYTFELIAKWAPETAINLVGSENLAEMAEQKLAGHPVDGQRLAAEIDPCFVEKDGRRADVLVLGCTHYPFLADDIERYAKWPVRLVDPSAAIARRVAEVLGKNIADVLPGGHQSDNGRASEAGALTFETTGAQSDFPSIARSALGLKNFNDLSTDP
ncbi:MAG: glutamate racemase [Stappiaceae bacterium]